MGGELLRQKRARKFSGRSPTKRGIRTQLFIGDKVVVRFLLRTFQQTDGPLR